ncbi:MAG: rhomboid family intramembrane serine protease [Candidatus Brocadiia bacterium]
MIPLYDKNPRESTPIVTWLLIGVNVLVYIMEISLSPAALDNLVENFALTPATHYDNNSFLGLSLMPFFTSQFLHGGWMHLLGNMLFLFVFGDNVEERLGHFGFLVFYLFTGFVAGLLFCSFVPHSAIPTVGASGAISGVLGAYLMLYPRAGVLTFIPPFFVLTLPAWFFIGEWFVVQMILASTDVQMQAGVAWWAHVGGFVSGAMLRFIMAGPPPEAAARQRL